MEINKTICKKCGQIKDRISTGKFNNKDKKWSDETGKLWNGRTCGSCNTERVRTLMRNKRNKDDKIES